MNPYYEYFLSSKGNRDLVFEDCFKRLGGAPLYCLEIGAARNLDFRSRQSDGWSSFHFYSYIKKYGGHLTICDIDSYAIDQCKKLFINSDLELVKFVNQDGLQLINDKYNLIYLDGSDNPADMVLQISMINVFKQMILCDDFHTKGSSAKGVYDKYISYKWRGHEHEMALYDKNEQLNILFETIQ